MFDLLKAPYPFYKLSKRRALNILLVGIFVGVFLLVFQPFGTDDNDFPYKNLFLLGYGVVVFSAILLIDLLIQHLLKNSNTAERWTVGKQIVAAVAYFLFTAMACYAYKTWYFSESFSWSNFLHFHFLSASIAIFPLTITILVDYIIKLKNNQSVAQKLTAQITPTAEKETIEQIVLFAENEKDQLQFLATELLYLQSADNYVEIVWQRNGALEKSLLRGSLQRMEQQITLPHIQRCHRSFIVNLEQVISVSGNAQGYKLHLPSEQILPVARSKSKDVLAQLK